LKTFVVIHFLHEKKNHGSTRRKNTSIRGKGSLRERNIATCQRHENWDQSKVMTLIRCKQNEDVGQNLINWSKGAHGPY